MNRIHALICSSGWWAQRVESELIPWGIGQAALGGDVLEIGPGFGATSIPRPELQDRAFAEVTRVLRPGGVFAGTDSVGTGLVFKAIHVGDTLMPIDPAGLPARLEAAGLEEAKVTPSGGSFRFRAKKPVA